MKFFRWVANLFKKKRVTRPTREEVSEDRETDRRVEGAHRKYKRVAFVRGHTDSSSGCSSYPVKMPADFPDRPNEVRKRREYDLAAYCIKQAKEFIDLESMSMAVKEFLRDGIGMSGVGRLLKKWKPDLVISWHKNSVGDKPSAKGAEILLLEKWKGTWVEDEARRMLRLWKFYFPDIVFRHDGGIKWMDGGRGSANLKYYGKSAPTLLLEKGFIGAKNKWSKQFLENDGLEKYSKSIAQFCLGYDVGSGGLIEP